MRLVRTRKMDDRTIGVLRGDDKRVVGFTLEDAVRDHGVKVYGRTAIPVGNYRVRVTMSRRFKRELPLVEGVPGFEGVRIHGGNGPEDTEGCVLVGKAMRGLDLIWNCAPAVDEAVRVALAEELAGGCWLAVADSERCVDERDGHGEA